VLKCLVVLLGTVRAGVLVPHAEIESECSALIQKDSIRLTPGRRLHQAKSTEREGEGSNLALTHFQAPAAKLLDEPSRSMENMAAALVQSERRQLEERHRTEQVLERDRHLQQEVAELRQELATRSQKTPEAVSVPSNVTRVTSNENKSVSSASANASFGSNRLEAILGHSKGLLAHKLPPSFQIALPTLAISCLLAVVFGLFGTCLGYLEIRSPFGVDIGKMLLILLPFIFLFAAVVWVNKISFLQYYAYLSFVMAFVLTQCMLAAAYIAPGLVQSALKLPRVVTTAFVNVEEELVEDLKELVKEIIGENPLDRVVDMACKLILEIIGPAIRTCGELLDVTNLIPATLYDVSRLSPLLGALLFLIFALNVWAVLATLVPLGLGLATAAVFIYMLLLLAAAHFADHIVVAFIYATQALLNFILGMLLTNLIPAENLDKALSLLGPDVPKATDLKTKVIFQFEI